MDFLLLQAKNLKPHRNIDIIFLLFLSVLKNYHLKTIHDSFSTRINTTICSAFNMCLTSLMCRHALRDHLLYVPACLRFFRAFLFDEPYVPSFFMCFTCLHFLRAFCASIILRALRVYFFYVALSALHHPHSQWHFWLFK